MRSCARGFAPLDYPHESYFSGAAALLLLSSDSMRIPSSYNNSPGPSPGAQDEKKTEDQAANATVTIHENLLSPQLREKSSVSDLPGAGILT